MTRTDTPACPNTSEDLPMPGLRPFDILRGYLRLGHPRDESMNHGAASSLASDATQANNFTSDHYNTGSSCVAQGHVRTHPV